MRTKETNYFHCNTDTATYEQLVAQTIVLGEPGDFVIHMADFYSLPVEVQQNIYHTPMVTE